MLSRRVLIAAFAGLALAGSAHAQTPATKLPVVATFSILGDFVRQVGGERIALTTLVGPDGDGHVYTPSPADARAVAEAKVVFVNGLNFEGWIERLVKASGTKATVVTATDGIKTIRVPGTKGHNHNHSHGHSHGHKHGHSHAGEADPHAWQNIPNAKVYVGNIRDALIKADPEGKAVYETNASAYLAELDKLDAEIKAAVARIPVGDRRIVTSHDSFGYFASAYGLTFTAPRGISTEAEPAARDIARLIRQIKADKIRAVFVENITDPRMIERIGKETGVRVGGKLYSDALSPADGPAPTYIEMMRHNIRVLTNALVS